MASESKSTEKKERLPFERRQNKRKTPKIAPSPVPPPIKNRSEETSLKAIPQAVSQRMAKRMAVFCGIPTVLGITSFFGFYWIISHNLLEIPSYVAMLVSLSLFGLGFVGLSYGIFSASWDEDRVGDWLGWQEFQANFGRTIAAWRSGKKEVEEK
ncbi:PAM68 family protein [Microcystis aeruginosa]|uniref:PAM68 family protein n=1 Tax=Microcystis aeruginosa TaxID=1126 RepID=UPI00232E0191|nr:PAM68 family protein [Microcystis aeruginosa]MDB9418123.1 PAM68 family protein [Microcystis aeruginosa CS-556/03]